MRWRYYSLEQDIWPGSCPRKGRITIRNFWEPRFCQGIRRKATGYVEYSRELTEKEVKDYHLLPAGRWYPVSVRLRISDSRLRVVSFSYFVEAEERPLDSYWKDETTLYKTRYYSDYEEAVRVRDLLRSLDFKVERRRLSATQGEADIFINGKKVMTFEDDIRLMPKEVEQGKDYYGEEIGGWASICPDAKFIIDVVWPREEGFYHYNEEICRKLGIATEDWI